MMDPAEFTKASKGVSSALTALSTASAEVTAKDAALVEAQKDRDVAETTHQTSLSTYAGALETLINVLSKEHERVEALINPPQE